MLDVDISRFLSACGLEPTPEAVAVARHMHGLGLLVAVLDGNAKPVVPGEGEPPRTAAEYLADARMERDREAEERERWRAKLKAWDESIAGRADRQPVAWLTRTEYARRAAVDRGAVELPLVGSSETAVEAAVLLAEQWGRLNDQDCDYIIQAVLCSEGRKKKEGKE